jgi:hypothetical protein
LIFFADDDLPLLFTGNIPRGVSVNKVHRKPEKFAQQTLLLVLVTRRFVFLCIAKRVTVNGVNVTISLRLGFRGIFSIDILNGLGI